MEERSVVKTRTGPAPGSSRNRAVAVTGIGVISPVGTGREEFWSSLKNGTSGIRRVSRFDSAAFPTRIAGEVDFDPNRYFDRREARKMDRFVQFAVACSRMAVEDAGISGKFDPDRSGVIFGTGIGGITSLVEQHELFREKGPERVSPFFIPMMIANMASGQVAIDLGFKGPMNTVVTACASGANAIGDAFEIIRRGDADVMVAGGAEAPLVPLAFAGFCSMKAMSVQNDLEGRASMPFDRRRDGFVMGEGAGAVVLESLDHALSRGARIYALVSGYGTSADAYHITAPSPNGEGPARAMWAAIRSAGLSPEDIDYINAHGTSTPANDANETQAIKKVFGERAYRVPVSSTKSMIGHLLGAAGAVETIAAIMALYERVIPPTINYEEPDPECDLDYVVNGARRGTVRAVLKNSFGFGGQNACLVLRSCDLAGEGPTNER